MRRTAWAGGGIRLSTALGAWVVCLVSCASFSAVPALASAQCSSCEDDGAGRAVAQLDCVTEEQLGTILSYKHDISNERLMREALSTAYEIAQCINDVRLFPEPDQREDFHSLQRRLFDFYQEIRQSETQHGPLHFQDFLASASLRIHFCMIDKDLGIMGCLTQMEEALKDYQSVFRAAVQIKADPEDSSNLELAEAMGMDLQNPAPEVSELKAFVGLSLENSLRFPRVLGKLFGTALGPVLCDAYQLYPDQRAYVGHHYNLLIRFDVGDMAAAGPLYQFVEKLKELFRPASGLASFFELQPGDWSPSPPPCSVDDLALVFPEFVVLPGYRLPSRQKLLQALSEVEVLLAQSAEFAQRRIHLWKAFHRHGTFLFELAQSLKAASSRTQATWEIRHLLMGRARDAFLLRAVGSHQHPYDPATLQSSISQQIRIYGEELLNELQLEALIDFCEEYLEAGQILLTEVQKQRLHRLLAIAYDVLEKRSEALAHLQQSDLQLSELEAIRTKFREIGVGIRSRK